MSGSSAATLLPSDLANQLAFPKTAVVNRVREAVERGWQILNAPADGPVAFNSFRANRSKWDDNNRESLRRLFKTDQVRQGYDKAGAVPTGAATPAIELERLRASMEHRLGLLQGILDRLGAGGGEEGASGPGIAVSSSKPVVFVAHAGDIGLARTIGRYLEAQRMTPVIVTDQPGENEIGVTQIDGYRDARFAIVLVAGESGGDGHRQLRPNPDATIWMGYFIGRLGRRRVCGLLQPGVEPPARQFGVRSYNYDESGAWKTMIGKAIELADGDDA